MSSNNTKPRKGLQIVENPSTTEGLFFCLGSEIFRGAHSLSIQCSVIGLQLWPIV